MLDKQKQATRDSKLSESKTVEKSPIAAESKGGGDGEILDFSVLQRRMFEVRIKEDDKRSLLNQNWKESKCNRTLLVQIEDWVRRLSFRDDTLAVGTSSGAVLVYDIPSAVMINNFDGNGVKAPDSGRLEVTCIAISLDGQFVASGSLDGRIKVHSRTENCCVYEANLGEGPVLGLTFHPDGATLVVVSSCWALEVQIGSWSNECHLRICDSATKVLSMAATLNPATQDRWYIFGLQNG
eukprot:CAMPEP_0196595608 /NCGR_PEP_ID=MMETSP1081-20130531/81607_1 /TAXON_ID=36882 /ORGANISM="Pyramimonas amylifera, Strain CCMP720" /LENGTH=238 /DNA_ID=CAMNT_0041920239 /DNA_START=116 /DNA_END=830 /DNA_ORIENTATION=+